MNDEQKDKFYGKIQIKGLIHVLTGLHIGSGSSSGIGLIDNPIIRDPLTKEPIIPGSSIKGRLRSALADIYGENDSRVQTLFGNSDTKKTTNKTRLYARDSRLTAETIKKLKSKELDSPFAEIKYENTIDRTNGTASNPRQQERLPAGSQLNFELTYNCYDSSQIADDLDSLKSALEYVQFEYLGGSGSRGYGQIKFIIDQILFYSPEYFNGSTSKAIDLINAVEPSVENQSLSFYQQAQSLFKRFPSKVEAVV